MLVAEEFVPLVQDLIICPLQEPYMQIIKPEHVDGPEEPQPVKVEPVSLCAASIGHQRIFFEEQLLEVLFLELEQLDVDEVHDLQLKV